MYDNNSKGISYTAGFFMLIAFAIAGLIFADLINQQLWEEMTGKNADVLLSGHFEPSDARAFRIIHIINNILGFLIPTFIVALILNRRPVELLGYRPGFRWAQLGLALLIIILAMFASDGLSYVNHTIPIPDVWRILFNKLEVEYSQQVESIIELDSPRDFIISLFYMAALPAICEETIFRGGLQNFLTRGTKKPWLSILIVSIIFSAVHFSFFGFLSRFFLGMVLGFLYHYSGKMWPNILAHFINNAIGLAALYMYKKEGKTMIQAMNESQPHWWNLLALPLVIGLLIFFKKISASDKETAV